MTACFSSATLSPIEHLVLIDGNHLMHRAYWAIPRTLKTTKGELVNVPFGVASMLISILKQEAPDAWVWCCDKGDETFRHAEHVEYKAGRQETPQEFYDQFQRVEQLLGAFGLPSAGDPKYEADDFLCSYAQAALAKGVKRITVITGDRDAFQLASEHVRIAIPHKGYQAAEYLGPAEVLAKYGVRPDQVPALKGLAGDSSDNLKGVGGIGPKTAAELLATYDTLEGIYEHLADIRPALRAKLEVDRESAFFCQRMALLICDAPLPVPLEETTLHQHPVAPLATLFDELEFHLLRRRLDALVKSDLGQRLFAGELPAEPQAKPKASSNDTAEKNQLSLF